MAGCTPLISRIRKASSGPTGTPTRSTSKEGVQIVACGELPSPETISMSPRATNSFVMTRCTEGSPASDTLLRPSTHSGTENDRAVSPEYVALFGSRRERLLLAVPPDSCAYFNLAVDFLRAGADGRSSVRLPMDPYSGNMMIEGRCQCGAVRYQADGEISDLSHCHCSMCRKLHGAAFATFADVARNGFRWIAGEDVVEFVTLTLT